MRLIAAELRLLPLLATHLSFPEIATELFLSRHTVKSQATSIYRKLGATSRNQAVTRARELGLLEGLRPAGSGQADQGADREVGAQDQGGVGHELPGVTEQPLLGIPQRRLGALGPQF